MLDWKLLGDSAVEYGDGLAVVAGQRAVLHIALNHPKFVLADIAAKRRIIELCAAAWDTSDCPGCNEQGYLADALLRLLAQPYAEPPRLRPGISTPR